jgi:hypothetical protein
VNQPSFLLDSGKETDLKCKYTKALWLFGKGGLWLPVSWNSRLLSYRMFVDLSRSHKHCRMLYNHQVSWLETSFDKMNSLELDECFDYVNQLVLKCGEVLKDGFVNTGAVTTKTAFFDVVTFWDGEIENILIKGIKEKYPDHKSCTLRLLFELKTDSSFQSSDLSLKKNHSPLANKV